MKIQYINIEDIMSKGYNKMASLGSLRKLIDAIYGELRNPAPQGSPQAIAAGKAMAAKVREQLYQPTTQTSREILGAVGEFLQPITGALQPTLGAVGTSINALAPAALMQAGAVARPAITQATAPVRNVLANVMTREQPGMVGMGAASTAEDLITVVLEAAKYPEIVQAARTSEVKIKLRKNWVIFHNTNPIIGKRHDFIVSKTGYINASGGCIVMMLDTELGQRIVVVLGSKNTHTRIPEAEFIAKKF